MKGHELMHSHFTMIFPSFHFTTYTHPSHSHYNLLPFTSRHIISPPLHFTSLHFTPLHFLMISLIPSLGLIYHFPNPFPKIT
jgi:hypothetical protein